MGFKFDMLHRVGVFLILLPLASLAFAWFQPSVRYAVAQDAGGRDRRDDDGDRPRGEGRRRGRGGFGDEGGQRGFRRDRGGDEGGDRGDRGRGGEDRPRGSGGTASATSASRPASGGGGSASLDTGTYARSLVKQLDKDGDMMLKGDERNGLRGKQATADSNNDGAITIDELTMSLSPNAPTAATTPSTTSRGDREGGSEQGRRGGGFGGGRRGRGRDRENDDRQASAAGGPATTRVYTALIDGSDGASGAADKRRTYRFTPAAERLPASGLPGWFKSRDANGDGQVAMSEYSRSWSTRTVDEFRRFDLNGDGVVTAREATGK